MIYKFTMDYVEYEADVTVSPGRPAFRAFPSEPPEIEINQIWMVGPTGKIDLDWRFSTQYAIVEKHLLDYGTDILDQYAKELSDGDADAADARNDAAREDL